MRLMRQEDVNWLNRARLQLLTMNTLGAVQLIFILTKGTVRCGQKDDHSPFHSSAGCRQLTQSIYSITTKRIELHCWRAQDGRTNRTHTRLILRGQSNCNIDEWRHDADAVLPKKSGPPTRPAVTHQEHDPTNNCFWLEQIRQRRTKRGRPFDHVVDDWQRHMLEACLNEKMAA